MRILLITTRRIFLGEQINNNNDDDDILAIYKQLANKLTGLDAIVISPVGYQAQKITDNFFVYPTDASNLWGHYLSVKRISARLFSNAYYDLIISSNPFFTAWLSYRLKIKYTTRNIVNVENDFWHNTYWCRKHHCCSFLIKFGWHNLLHANAIQVPSQGLKNKLVHVGIGAGKIKVNPFFVNVQRIIKPDNQTVNSIQNEFKGKKIILWVGDFTAQSNYQFIFKILKSLVNIESNLIILMVGVGARVRIKNIFPSDKFFEEYIKIINLSSLDELTNYYHAANIVIQTSYFDSRAINLWQAAAAAKPSVSFATAGAKQVIIDKKTGYLVPINNQKQFVYSIIKLLQNDKLGARFAEEAYRHFKTQFYPSNIIRQTLNNWRQVIA